MSIDPTKSSGAHPLNGARLDQAAGNQSARNAAQRGADPAPGSEPERGSDHVEISREAREAGSSEGGTSASGLTRGRLREILTRLTSGYYDSPQVAERIAHRIQEDPERPMHTD